jgi:hypothetical protein
MDFPWARNRFQSTGQVGFLTDVIDVSQLFASFLIHLGGTN